MPSTSNKRGCISHEHFTTVDEEQFKRKSLLKLQKKTEQTEHE